MNILGINTTGKNGAVACLTCDGIFVSKLQNPYSENIMAGIIATLEKANISLDNIDAIGIVVGPGSFTGIRIGVAATKGLLCAKNIKSIEINSFDLISYNINEKNFVVLLDSGNQDVYYGIYKNNKIAEIGASTVERITEFAQTENLKIFYSNEEKEVFENFSNLIAVEIAENTLINSIKSKAENGEFVDISNISPVYIKQSQAEIGLKQKTEQSLAFRKAELADAEALSIIDEQCFDGYESYSKETFVDELSLSDRHYVVATYNNLVVGYVGLWQTGDDLNLLKIAVLPQYRMLGIGFKLMNMCFDFRKEKGLNSFFLEVRENNERAVKLYKKFGFKTKHIREKYYKDGENCLVMFA